MANIYILIILLFVLVGLRYCIRVLVSMVWIKKARNFRPNEDNYKQFFIIIPVLDETGRLPSTVDYFLSNFCLSDNCKLVLVTTEKEKSYFQSKTQIYTAKVKTIATVNQLKTFADSLAINFEPFAELELNRAKKQLIKKIEERENTIDCVHRLIEKHGSKICTFHYPHTDGKMAHQINYAIKKINTFLKTGNNTIYGIFNADSRPHHKTLDYVKATSPKTHDFFAFQQYGNYLKNNRDFESSIQGSILMSSALWQTKWSLAIEMFNSILHSKIRWLHPYLKDLLYPVDYCIGHGLFVTKACYDKIGGFNENTYNEDAEFGFELGYHEIPIIPIPFFDLSDSPDTVMSLYKQKSGWFFNPLQSFEYYGLMNKKYASMELDKIKLGIMALRFFFYAIYWLLGPAVFTLTFFASLISLKLIYLYAILFSAYLVIPTFLTYLIMLDIDPRELKDKKLSIILKIIIGSPIAYILHGMSAARTIVLLAKKRFFSIELEKNKTEMKI